MDLVYEFKLLVMMSERFRVTKSEEAVLFRNYGSTADDDAEDDVGCKSGGPQVVIGNNLHGNKDQEEEEERDTGRNP